MNPIDTHIATHLNTTLQEIIELCRQPSVSATGHGVRECAGLVQRVLALVLFGVIGIGSLALLQDQAR